MARSRVGTPAIRGTSKHGRGRGAARAGVEVFLVLATSGGKGSGDPKMASQRLVGARAAGGVLGLKDVVCGR